MRRKRKPDDSPTLFDLDGGDKIVEMPAPVRKRKKKVRQEVAEGVQAPLFDVKSMSLTDLWHEMGRLRQRQYAAMAKYEAQQTKKPADSADPMVQIGKQSG